MITSEYFNVLKHTQNHAPNLPQPPALPAAPSVAASAARHSWQRWLCGGLGQAAASSHSDSRATSCPPVFTKQLSASIQQQMFSVAFLHGFLGVQANQHDWLVQQAALEDRSLRVCRRLTRLTRVIINSTLMDTLGGVETPTGFLI